MSPRGDSLEEYLRSYPRLCAAMISFSGLELTPHGAAFLLRDAHERPRYDPGARALPVPTRERSLVARAYQHRHALRGYAADYQQTLAIVRAAIRPVAKPPALDRAASRYEPSLPSLILTPEGFLNLDQ